MYIELKPLSEKDDLSKLEISKVDWDVVVDGKPQQLVRIEDRPHGEGGEYGINEYYIYPFCQEMTVENLTPYWGTRGGVAWGFSFEYKNYFRGGNGFHKNDEIRRGASCWITRNGKKFYEIRGRDHEYALAKAQVELVQLMEGPVEVCSRDWEKKLIGGKVWYKGQPGVISRIVDGQGQIFIKPDGIDSFKPHESDYESDYDKDCWIQDYGDGFSVDFLSSHIGWFRK